MDSNARREASAARMYSVADVSYAANVEVARWLAEHTTPDDRVYLWGFEPHVYYRANRLPGSRFIYNVPQRGAWSKSWSRPALMADLDRSKPKIIAVLRHDIFPVVTGDLLDSTQSLQGFPELLELLSLRYSLVEQLQDFDLYRRREPLDEKVTMSAE
jgi:hypothetical protein